ncbi:hypothetical protein [Treponema sp. C6A8]|uniref:hypothetical protein n=1 Tax=Treponema sp. C6A8 TaxID=1410609 RepID=UPI000480B3D8|nr:hypothetical protein [Treponema sp. C6A8]
MTSSWESCKRFFSAFFIFSLLLVSGFSEDQEADALSDIDISELQVPEIEVPEYLSKDFKEKTSLLSFSEFENEVIQPDLVDGSRVMVYSIGNKTSRWFFDDEYRLSKIEHWEIAGFSDSKIVKQEFFKYHGREKRIYNKIIESADKGESFFYLPDNLVEKSEKYKKVNDRPYITEICRYKYDSQKRISEISTRTFSYNSEEDTKRRGVFVKTYKYKYNPLNADGEEIPPDVSYYENDVLKSVEKYSQVLGSFTQQYFFNGGISVKTWFVDYNRVKEVIYQEDRVLRVHKFDDEEKLDF